MKRPTNADPTRHPLTWPTGWPRTKATDRQTPTWTMSQSSTDIKDGQIRKITKTLPINMSTAVTRLQDQLDRLGASDVVLSTNVELRMDGLPKSGRVPPADVGAAVYFRLQRQDRCLACDRWSTVEGNIAAIANHIDALRRIERYGIGTLDQAFAGYVGLPAKGTTWRTTLGFDPDDDVTASEIQEAFRTRAKAAHPDVNGGSHDAMASLVAARDEGLAELRR